MRDDRGAPEAQPADATEAQPADAPGEPFGRPAARALEPRTAAALLAGTIAVVLFAVLALVPVPYAVMRPGPVRDVLADVGGVPLITITGTETFPTGGALDLLTVRVQGGPGGRVTLQDVFSGYFDPEVSVRPVRELFPPDLTQEQADEDSSREMVSSQENATAAALAALDIEVPATLSVVGTTPGSDAEQQLEVGDVVTAVDDREVTDLPQLRDLLQDVTAGEAVVVELQREGEQLDVPVLTRAGQEGQTLLGVLLDPEYDFPFDVQIEIENIGGPSAGMIFALGIIDKLTPGELTGGERIAGTGTIDSAGGVGPIGGVQQKLVGAEAAGATWFLAPSLNCDEVVGHVPDGLSVASVATLEQAVAATEAIAANPDTTELPTCS